MCAFFLTEFIDWDSLDVVVGGHLVAPGWSLANSDHSGGATGAAFTPKTSPIHNWQEVHWCSMAKRTSLSEPEKRLFKTTGLHLPADQWELLNRVAFERARTKGGRASVSALLVKMIERHRRELEKELVGQK